jgi:hypothetical protein
MTGSPRRSPCAQAKFRSHLWSRERDRVLTPVTHRPGHIVKRAAKRHNKEGIGMSAEASRCARRKLALRLGTLTLTRRLSGDSWRSPRRAIGPAELIRASGSTWNEVDAASSLRASFGCAVRRRAPQVGIIRHADALLDQRHVAGPSKCCGRDVVLCGLVAL